MKILSAKTTRVTKWVTIKVVHDGKAFDVSVETVDGKIDNEQSGVYTSYLTYFNKYSREVREKHFKKIKEYIKRHIK